MRPRPVLLVHGACHGAWCWAALQAELDRRGVPSFALDLPGHGTSRAPLADLHGDAAAVAEVLEGIDEEVVLVGHSYGGAVITQAGLAGRVAHLVYVAAIVPEEGRSAADALADASGGDDPPPSPFGRDPKGRLVPDPARAAAAFYGTCDPVAATAAVARLCSQRAATLVQPASVAAWRERPSTYVRCLQDAVLPLGVQDHMAARCGTVTSLDTDHSPFICAPGPLADVLAPLSTA